MAIEKRLFSKATQDKAWMTALVKSSVSREDAKIRINEYNKLFSNYADLKDTLKKTFSSYADNDLVSNQYFNASVTGMASSFAGYLTIERALDNPTALFYFLDLIGVTAGRPKVLPNIGAENIGAYQNRFVQNYTLTAATTQTVAVGGPVIPGSVKLTLVVGPSTFIITDDKMGNLVAPGGVIDASTVDYTTGNIVVNFAAATTGTLSALAFEDQVATNNVNRFTIETNHKEVVTYPEMLIGETDIIALTALKKSLSVDPGVILQSKLVELYTKLINRQIVGQITSSVVGVTPTAIDITGATLTPGGFSDFRSTIDAFSGGLIDVDAGLAGRSVKGVRATAYVAGASVIQEFRKTKQIGMFVDAPRSYVNDLVGYYDGVPVLEHRDIASDFGYAIHKTSDGNLAPVARAMYLPLTNTPQVGNYGNPTNYSEGVFYQERSEAIVPELIQPFQLITTP